MVDSNRPNGVKFVAYYYYALVIILVFALILNLFHSNSILLSIGQGSWYTIIMLISILFLPVKIAYSTIGMFAFPIIFSFFVARGILRGNNKWRIVILILESISFIYGIFFSVLGFRSTWYNIGKFYAIQSIFFLIITTIIIIYLGFNKSCKEWFRSQTSN